MDSYAQKLIDHYQQTFSAPTRQLRLEEGRIAFLPDHFRVLVFPHQSQQVYATCCMSQPQDEPGLELHLVTKNKPEKEHDIVMLLHAVAEYHRTGATLGLGHTVNFGMPWQPGSQCTKGYISLPYLFGPTLEWLKKPEVRCLWLIPVTPAEVEFKKQQGIDALEDRFEGAQFDYDDPMRASVV